MHELAPAVATFAASLVEFVEALTVVLAVGAVRGWRGAIGGASLALLLLLGLVAVAGPALIRIPLRAVHLGIGMLLLLFGLRWLRKAILRAAGVIPLHDEAALYARQTERLRGATRHAAALDPLALATAFKITMVEGIEVVFIVIAIGAGGRTLLPASFGAGAALVVVIALGIVLHRPVARLPENALKFGVGVLLCAFGTFWLGEGVWLAWPWGDAALPLLAGVFLAGALAAVKIRGSGPAQGTA